MKKRTTLLLSLIAVFAVSATIGANLICAPKTAAVALNEETATFSLGEVKLINTKDFITTRSVWAEEVTYTPQARTFNYGSNAGLEVQGPTLYGYQLKSNNAYSNTVLTSNTSTAQKYNDGTNLTVNGYSVPGTHAVTTSINETINTDTDVDFYMGTIVDAKQGSGTHSNRFYMVLSDTDGRVEYNGFKSSGNFFSMSFSRNADAWGAEGYDARQQNYGAWVYVGKNGDTYGTDAGGNTGATTTTGVNKALYGQPIQGWGNSNNYFWSDAYEKSERLVRVKYHFYEDNDEAYVSVTLTSVYKDNINEVEHYPDNTVSPSYTYTAKLSDFGLTLNSQMKLYFGFSNVQANWFSQGSNYDYDDDEEGNGTPRSDALKRTLPMSLQLYNYTNGIKDISANEEYVKVTAGGSYTLTDNMTFIRFTTDANNVAPTFTFTSDNANFVVNGNTLNVAANANGIANITATAEDKVCTFKVWADGGYVAKAAYTGDAGTLGDGGTAGSVNVYGVANDAIGLYGYKAEGTAYYYGWSTRFTYDYNIDVSKSVSFLLEPNYESSGPGGNNNSGTKHRKIHIEMNGSSMGAVAWDIFAPWAGGKPEKIRFSGTGTSLADTSSNQNFVNAFYADNHSSYYFKVKIVPNGTSSQLIFSAVDKATLVETGTSFAHTFTMPYFSGDVSLSISYYTGNNTVASVSDVPERERVTNLNFGVYNFANGDVKTLSAEGFVGEAGDEKDLEELVNYSLFDGQQDPVLVVEPEDESIAVYENGKIKIPANASSGSTVVTVSAGEVSTSFTVQCKNEYITAKNLSLGTDLTFKVYAKAPLNSEPSVRFVLGEIDVVVDGEYDEGEDEWVFPFEGIAPQVMGEELQVSLIVGGVVCEEKQTTIKSYLENTFNRTESEKLKTLIANLLAYGAASQVFTDYDIEHLVIDEEGDIAEYVDDEYVVADKFAIDNATAQGAPKFVSTNVYFAATNSIIAYFTVDSIEGLTVTVNGEDATFERVEGNKYCVYSDAVSALDFDEEYVFVISDGENTSTLTMSVGSYVKMILNNSNNDSMKNLAKKLYAYGKAAEDYAG